MQSLHHVVVLQLQVVLGDVTQQGHDHGVFLTPGAHHVVQDALDCTNELCLIQSWPMKQQCQQWLWCALGTVRQVGHLQIIQPII